MVKQTRINRKQMLLGALSIASLAACSSGPDFRSALPKASGQDELDRLYTLMRKTGVYAINDHGTYTILPEMQGKIPGLPGYINRKPLCTVEPLGGGGRGAMLCDSDPSPSPGTLPTITTITVYGGGSATISGYDGYNFTNIGGFFGGGGLLGAPATGPVYTGSGPKDCAIQEASAILNGMRTTAQTIIYSNKYGAELVQAAKWFIGGEIAVDEFIALLLAFCGPAELLGLLAAVGLTVLAIYIYIKCKQG